MGSTNNDTQGLINVKPPILDIQHALITPATAVVTLSGKLMLGQESAQLQTLVPDLLSQGAKNIIFDISGVHHIDSTGIGRFIDSYSRIGKSGGQMRLVGAGGAVREAFRVTRLDTIFKFYENVENARQGLA